jgi:hypothetical protein
MRSMYRRGLSSLVISSVRRKALALVSRMLGDMLRRPMLMAAATYNLYHAFPYG